MALGGGVGQRARDVAMTVWVTCPEETCEYLGLFLQVHVPPRPPPPRDPQGGRAGGWRRLSSCFGRLRRPLGRRVRRGSRMQARSPRTRTHARAQTHARAPSHAQELGNEAAAVCAEKRPRRIKPGTAEWARAQLVQRNTSGIA